MEQNTALLVLDMQSSVLQMLPDANNLLGNVSKAIAKAREQNSKVIYVILSFRPNAPEISPNNTGFMQFKENILNIDLNEWEKIDERVAPLEDDIIIIRRRMSAFTGSDLEVVLRSLSITHLALAGFASRGVVLSTAREAADKDYKVTVLSDCCADTEADVHKFLMEKVFIWGADVKTLQQLD